MRDDKEEPVMTPKFSESTPNVRRVSNGRSTYKSAASNVVTGGGPRQPTLWIDEDRGVF